MGKYHVKFKKKNTNTSMKWIMIITLWSFIISAVLNFISSILLEKLNIGASFLILLIIILFGILCDIIGVAVATAVEIPLHSMAASKIRGASESIFLIRNASAVSNFFNDVIGDICSIITGAASAVIVVKLLQNFSLDKSLIDILLGAVVAAIMIGGKAIGKGIAIKNANIIVYKLGYVMSFFVKQK